MRKNKDKKVRIIASGLYLVNALHTYEKREYYDYEHSFEIHLPGYVILIDDNIEIKPIFDGKKDGIRQEG